MSELEVVQEDKKFTQSINDGAVGFIAGTNGAIASVFVGQPLDTIKVKMQAFPEIHSSAWKCFRRTLTTDGVARGLYSGTSPALVANIAENAVLFCALPFNQGLLSAYLNKDMKQLTDFEEAVAGCGAAFWSSLALCPTELVKCKMQSQREVIQSQGSKSVRKISAMSVTREIYRSDGLRGFTKGMIPTLAREMPGYFCFFGGYELSRTMFLQSGQSKEDLSAIYTAISGGFGGISLWLAIFPFDVVKSRMQVSPQLQSSSMGQIIKHIIRNEGFANLYKGLGPTLVRTFPATACLFVVVEWTKKILGN